MWMLPEIKSFEAEFGADRVQFNTCAYQKNSRGKWVKPGMFGRLRAGRVAVQLGFVVRHWWGRR